MSAVDRLGLTQPGQRRSAPAVAGATAALARRALIDARVRTISFVYLFAIASYLNPVAYRHTYSTLAERLQFAHSFANNKAVVLFYGKAYDLLTVGGYAAWRTGGILSILAAVFGLLAAVRALRAEEDAGRAELVLSASVSRGNAYAGAMIGIAVQVALLWGAVVVGCVLASLPVGQSAYLALAIVSVAAVFAGVGAVASQLGPTRRVALELGGALLALSFALRVIADTSSGAGWLRWATPLGWAEELRPFTGAQPLVLLLPLLATTLLVVLARRLGAKRDIGAGLLAARDEASPRLGLLSSPTAQALRDERTSLLVWFAGIAAFALIIGIISASVNSLGISPQLQREFARLGTGAITTPKGYLGFAFIFFVLVLSLFACSQMAAARREESEQRLETLLALPVRRTAWLGGRIALAAGAALVLALSCGLFAWIGAVSQGVHVSLGEMLGAGLNCLPVPLLFLGLAALAYALVPRASAGIAYGLVTIGFLWQLVGSLLGAPGWLVKLTPFAHVGAVPAQSFRAGDAAVMLAVGAVAAALALLAFARRDLTGA